MPLSCRARREKPICDVAGAAGGWTRRWSPGLDGLRLPGLPLFAGSTIQAVGVQFFLPILPLYLAHRGASPGLVGLTMAAGIAGFGAAQYPSGLLADRIDRRAIVIAGTLLYGAFFPLYLLPLPPIVVPLIRFCHAGSGGLYTPAALALIAELTPQENRARAFGLWQATWQSGLLVGPLIGGAVASVGLGPACVVATVACVLSAIPMLRLPSSRGTRSVVAARGKLDLTAFRRVFPSVRLAAYGDYVTGAVTGAWALLLLASGASTLQIGLSFTLFALPVVTLSAPAGAWVDRGGARRIITIGMLACAAVALAGALVTHALLLIGVGMLLGLAIVPARPTAFAQVSRMFSLDRQAEGQSILQTALYGVQVVGALVSGALVGVGSEYMFMAIAAVCLACLGSLVFVRIPAAATAGS